MNLEDIQTVSQYRHCHVNLSEYTGNRNEIYEEAVFHCFGLRDANNGRPTTRAIIEAKDGRVYAVDPTFVKFDNFYKNELAATIEKWAKDEKKIPFVAPGDRINLNES